MQQKSDKKVYIDASAYLSLLNPHDSNHTSALHQAVSLNSHQYITTQAVLGEVLTVGAMRFDKKLTIKFVDKILGSHTIVILESPELVLEAWKIFKKVSSKNISWVDCFSQSVIQKYNIAEIFTFDTDFKRMQNM